MGYINTGLFIGSISTIVFLILTLKKRWFKKGMLKDLFHWWDGKKAVTPDLMFSVVVSLKVVLLTPLIIALTWGVLLPIGFLVFIVLKIRKRNINKNKEN
jgi:hypothetical protein